MSSPFIPLLSRRKERPHEFTPNAHHRTRRGQGAPVSAVAWMRRDSSSRGVPQKILLGFERVRHWGCFRGSAGVLFQSRPLRRPQPSTLRPVREPASPGAAAIYIAARSGHSAIVGALTPPWRSRPEATCACAQSVDGEGARAFGCCEIRVGPQTCIARSAPLTHRVRSATP